MTADEIKNIVGYLEKPNFTDALASINEIKSKEGITADLLLLSYIAYDLMFLLAEHRKLEVKKYERIKNYYLNKLKAHLNDESNVYLELSIFLYKNFTRFQKFLWFDREQILFECLGKSLSINPNNKIALFMKCNFKGDTKGCIKLLKTGNYDEEFIDKYLSKVVFSEKETDTKLKLNFFKSKYNPSDKPYLFNYYCSKLKKYPELYIFFEQNPEFKDSNKFIYQNFGDTCFHLKKYQEAIDFLGQKSAKDFKDYIKIGDSYKGLKDKANAIKFYKKAYEDSEKLSVGFDGVSKLIKLNAYDEVKQILQKIEKYPTIQIETLKFYQAKILSIDKKYRDSIKKLEEIEIVINKNEKHHLKEESYLLYVYNNFYITLAWMNKDYKAIVESKSYNLDTQPLLFQYSYYKYYQDFKKYLQKLYTEFDFTKYSKLEKKLYTEIINTDKDLHKKIYLKGKEFNFKLDIETESLYLSKFKSKDKIQERIDIYLGKLKKNPKNPNHNLNVGLLYFNKEEYILAKKYLNEAIKYEDRNLSYLNGIPQLTLININNILKPSINDYTKENSELFAKTMEKYISFSSSDKSPQRGIFTSTQYKYKSFTLNTISSLANDYLYFSNNKKLNDPFELNTGLIEDSIRNLKIDNNLFKIFSLSVINNNSLMWAHYADEHKGICIGYCIDYIPQSICKERVIYKDNRLEKAKTFDNLINYLQTKDECWAYEKEIRLLHFGKDEKHDYCLDRSVGLAERKITLKIKEIVLGLRFEISNEKILAPIVREIEKRQKQKVDILKAHKDEEFPLKLNLKSYKL